MPSQANLAIDWRAGYGPIAHRSETIERMQALVQRLVAQRRIADEASAHALLAAADRVACTAMSVVAHMTYARRIDRSGCPLGSDDFKQTPEGHTGGSLNMVPAFVGYLLANALTGTTRGWLMGRACVAAIEAVNALTGDVSAAQRGRYDRSEAGLSRLIADFYPMPSISRVGPVPLGSHAGPNTAGAISEGGYLGFAGLQYVHTPLPGESLVAFLSDGAFEEQRGSDWAPRWWRAEDCGFAIPVMILNGRRIEQRTQIVQEGGATWLAEDLRHNGLIPVIVDGRDPMAIAWAIVEAEDTLSAFAARSDRRYPVKLPYVIAETEKGFGFPGAATNAAHNLPLDGNPREDAGTRGLQCRGCGAVRAGDRTGKRAHHSCESRPEPALARKRAPMARRHPASPQLPMPTWGQRRCRAAPCPHWTVGSWSWCRQTQLRIRIGNPDELASNKMGGTTWRCSSTASTCPNPASRNRRMAR